MTRARSSRWTPAIVMCLCDVCRRHGASCRSGLQQRAAAAAAGHCGAASVLDDIRHSRRRGVGVRGNGRRTWQRAAYAATGGACCLLPRAGWHPRGRSARTHILGCQQPWRLVRIQHIHTGHRGARPRMAAGGGAPQKATPGGFFSARAGACSFSLLYTALAFTI